MVQVLTGVKDEAAENFMEISPTNTTSVAIRRFSQMVQGDDNSGKFMRKNAKDFNLYKLGEFDLKTGEIKPVIPTIIARATEFTMEEKKNG